MKSRLLILGPPAGGKGTHAERLAAELGVPHIATGDMLRKEVSEGSDLGVQAKAAMDAGELVSDELVGAMLVERLEREDASEGWIIDGFPRDLEQAQVLDAELGNRGVDLVIALEVERADIIERTVGRRVCPRGHVYHLTHNPPETPGVCDIDGEALVQRDDDTEEVIVHRIEVYHDESGALLDFYDSKGVLRKVDASGPPDDTYARIHAMVNSS
jgi:adenylate kinase